MMKSAYIPPHKRPKAQSQKTTRTPQADVHRHSFDHETGQVYDEVEVVFNKKQNSDWIGEYKTPSIVRKLKPPESGSRSLLDTAKNRCIKEFRNFTPQHFEAIPWSIASAMWKTMVSSHTESFHSWRTLASVYNNSDEFGQSDHRYHLVIKQPPLPIHDYFRGLTSPDARWLVTLRISPKQIPVPDLVAIANISNLSILDLSDGQMLLDLMPSRFDERIMQSWAELAAAGRAFRHLQVLILGWQDSLSDWIFKYLQYFPRLTYIITTDCRHMHQKNRPEWENVASSHGWTAKHAKKSAKMLRPLLDDKSFHAAAVSSLYYHSQEQLHAPSQAGYQDLTTRLPMVECWLGTPRSWSHILDEFPGTRTIWFEKDRIQAGNGASESVDRESVIDSTKRSRERAVSQPLSAPPSKRAQNARNTRPKPPKSTAASLLADMGMQT